LAYIFLGDIGIKSEQFEPSYNFDSWRKLLNMVLAIFDKIVAVIAALIGAVIFMIVGITIYKQTRPI